MNAMRIGTGFDVHRFGEGDHIILGGVRIPHGQGMIAHSDGDVLLHALADALLGAVGMRDIGHHFPDTDSAYHNIDSRVLLRAVHALLQKAHWRVANVDATLIAEVPKMAPYITDMCNHIASDLQIASQCVNVKATTTEGLGYIGKKEGIAAQTAVLVYAHDASL